MFKQDNAILLINRLSNAIREQIPKPNDMKHSTIETHKPNMKKYFTKIASAPPIVNVAENWIHVTYVSSRPRGLLTFSAAICTSTLKTPKSLLTRHLFYHPLSTQAVSGTPFRPTTSTVLRLCSIKRQDLSLVSAGGKPVWQPSWTTSIEGRYRSAA